MKTLASVITGRKDEPTFNTDDNNLILDYIKSFYSEDAYFNDDGNIVTSADEFRIVNVEIIEF